VASLLVTDPHTAVPQVTELDVYTDTQLLSNWTPVITLLESHAQDQDFVVETENDGTALLRFGDGVYGLDPQNGSYIFVQYRIGVGSNGNVGADSLVHVINPGTFLNFPSLIAVRNPLAAWGGTDPQPIEQVKLLAPAAFQAVQYRAVTEADYAAILGVNVAGFFHTTQLAIAEMEKRGSGHVVQVSTSLVDHAMSGVPSVLASLTKGGLNGATKSLAIEYARGGIRVNAVALGVIKSPMHPVEAHPQLDTLHPVGHMGEVSDVVDAILYLESASFVTGEILHVDGGQSAGH